MNRNAMATMPVKKLMLSTCIPIMFSMVLQSVYNIVDSAFVSNIEDVGGLALNALTLAYPFQMLMGAVVVGTGVGASVLLSRTLGQDDLPKARQVTGNTLFVSLIITIAFMIFGIVGVGYFIGSQTSNEIIYGLGVDYLSICCIGSVGLSYFLAFEKLLQSTGRAMQSTIAQIAGALTNIILDPILIYGLLGFKAYGVKGAAYATIFGQMVAMVVSMCFHFKLNKHLHSSIKDLKPSWRIIKEIYTIGIPAIIAQALASVMAYGLNIIFLMAGETVVTIYGLYYKAQLFVMMAIYGLRDGATPILAFALGMGNKERINDAIRNYLTITTVIAVAGTVLFELFAGVITQIFGFSGEVYSLCVVALRITATSFFFAAANISIQGTLQALDNGVGSLIISVSRQIVFMLPVAYLFAMIAVMNTQLTWTVWLTFLIGEGVSFAISVYLLKRTYKSRISDNH